MQLKDITIKQFIAITDIAKNGRYSNEIERDTAILQVLTGKPEKYFEDMSLTEFKKLTNGLGEITLAGIDANAKKYIKANGKIYAPVYNFGKLTSGQFIDATHFLKDQDSLIENLPKILASICVPTKRGLFGRKLLKYGAEDHADVAANFEEALIVDAYGISVFFFNVWINFLSNTGAYMVKTMIANAEKTKTPLTKAQTEILLNILEVYGDGTIARKKSQQLKG